jgi:hypothetical protein
VDLIHKPHDKDQLRTLVNTVMILDVPLRPDIS